MDAEEAAEHLARIRRIMESATQLTVLPGKAAIVGGVLCLAGCWVTYRLMGCCDFGRMRDLAPSVRMQIVGVWLGVAAAGLAVDIAMTVLSAGRQGRRPWTRLAQMAAYAVGPGVAAGIVLTVALVRRDQWQMVPGTWMVLYGGALWMASVMSVRAPRVLGVAFFVGGVAALLWASHVALVLVGATFGLGHIAFGAYLLARFGD